MDIKQLIEEEMKKKAALKSGTPEHAVFCNEEREFLTQIENAKAVELLMLLGLTMTMIQGPPDDFVDNGKAIFETPCVKFALQIAYVAYLAGIRVGETKSLEKLV